ncbi:MAG: MarR family transcriptional regulator [Methanothrix sp.]|nr:MarR family transcriptional regulator [Methanothrix sp.]
MPPSAKLVFKVLESGSLLTQKDIIARTYLPARTVRYALTRLKKENLLLERFYFPDARQSLYGLNAHSPEVISGY